MAQTIQSHSQKMDTLNILSSKSQHDEQNKNPRPINSNQSSPRQYINMTAQQFFNNQTANPHQFSNQFNLTNPKTISNNSHDKIRQKSIGQIEIDSSFTLTDKFLKQTYQKYGIVDLVKTFVQMQDGLIKNFLFMKQHLNESNKQMLSKRQVSCFEQINQIQEYSFESEQNIINEFLYKTQSFFSPNNLQSFNHQNIPIQKSQQAKEQFSFSSQKNKKILQNSFNTGGSKLKHIYNSRSKNIIRQSYIVQQQNRTNQKMLNSINLNRPIVSCSYGQVCGAQSIDIKKSSIYNYKIQNEKSFEDSVEDQESNCQKIDFLLRRIFELKQQNFNLNKLLRQNKNLNKIDINASQTKKLQIQNQQRLPYLNQQSKCKNINIQNIKTKSPYNNTQQNDSNKQNNINLMNKVWKYTKQNQNKFKQQIIKQKNNKQHKLTESIQIINQQILYSDCVSIFNLHKNQQENIKSKKKIQPLIKQEQNIGKQNHFRKIDDSILLIVENSTKSQNINISQKMFNDLINVFQQLFGDQLQIPIFLLTRSANKIELRNIIEKQFHKLLGCFKALEMESVAGQDLVLKFFQKCIQVKKQLIQSFNTLIEQKK